MHWFIMVPARRPGNRTRIRLSSPAGPIGLATLLTAKFFTPSQIIMIDPDDNRLDVSRRLGATSVINNSREDAVLSVKLLTQDIGADVVIEAVGIPQTFELCQLLVAPGGVIANIGVHGTSAKLYLEKLWSRNITITTRLVDTTSTSLLLKTISSGSLDPKELVTHRFPLKDIEKAYDTFQHASREKALKVILINDQ